MYDFMHSFLTCWRLPLLQPFKEARCQALETVNNLCGLGTIVTSIILLIMAASSAVRSQNPGFSIALTAFSLVPQVAGFGNL
jgi:hypothetical protein